MAMSPSSRRHSVAATAAAVAAVLLIVWGTWFAAAHSARSGPGAPARGAPRRDSSSWPFSVDSSFSPPITIATGPDLDLHGAPTTTYGELSTAGAIAATLAGFPTGTFEDLTLAPTHFERRVENRYQMTAVVNVASSSGAALMRASWEGCLADGAMSEHLVRDSSNLGTAIQGLVYARLPDGSREEAGGCGSDVAAGQLFGAQADRSTDDQIVASVKQTLGDLGVHVDRVEVLRPLGPAVDVTVTVPDVQDAHSVGDRVFAALHAKPSLYEGVFIEVDGPDGSPVNAGGDATRGGVGGEWDSQGGNPIPPP